MADIPQRRSVSWVALFVAVVAFACAVYRELDAYDFAQPWKPAFDVTPTNTAGTATVKGEGGYHSTPPEAPLEPRGRMIAGAAILQ